MIFVKSSMTVYVIYPLHKPLKKNKSNNNNLLNIHEALLETPLHLSLTCLSTTSQIIQFCSSGFVFYAIGLLNSIKITSHEPQNSITSKQILPLCCDSPITIRE